MPFARMFSAPSTLPFGIKVKISLVQVLYPDFWRRLCDEDFPDPTTAHLTDEIRCTCAQETGRGCPAPAGNCSPLRNPIAEKGKKIDECKTRTSQEVTHPSTTLAQVRLTSEFLWDPVH